MSAPCQLLCFAIVINTSLLFAVDYYNTKSVILVFLNMILGVEDLSAMACSKRDRLKWYENKTATHTSWVGVRERDGADGI